MSEWSLLGLPLLAGLLVISTHVWLGHQVLKRGIVFIDLALAQVAALGSLIAGSLAPAGWELPVSLVFALLGALVVAALVRRYPGYQEALIGLIYVGAATVAVLWVAEDPHGAQKLAATLSGDILWVTWSDTVLLAGVTALGWGIMWGAPRWSRGNGFYVLFALLVSVSVQQLGLYLVFCTLIVPALATRHLLQLPPWAAYGLGVVGYAAGLALSLLQDWPSGASVVVALLALGTVCLAVCDKSGGRGDDRSHAAARGAVKV